MRRKDQKLILRGRRCCVCGCLEENRLKMISLDIFSNVVSFITAIFGRIGDIARLFNSLRRYPHA